LINKPIILKAKGNITYIIANWKKIRVESYFRNIKNLNIINNKLFFIYDKQDEKTYNILDTYIYYDWNYSKWLWELSSINFDKDENIYFIRHTSDWLLYWYKCDFSDYNIKEKSNTILKLKIAEDNLIKTKTGKKYLYKLEDFISKLSIIKLQNVSNKIDKINLNDSRYKKYKDILEYIKYRILVELETRK